MSAPERQAPACEAVFISSIHDLSATHWDSLSGDDYPFLRHAFLAALEDSRATCAASGWEPHHLLLYPAGKVDLEQTPLALLPLYVKTHSYGEYVFDWSWADAYQRHGMAYYPKLLSAIPFTPATGPRFCVRDDEQRSALLACAVQAIQAEAELLGASGWHLLFPDEGDSRRLAALGVRAREGCQYHWYNRGYEDFDALLASFSSRKRKNIRKERQRVAAAGIRFHVLRGEQITPALWQRFYGFYEHTYLIRGRPPYLNQRFFELLGAAMPEQLLLVMAEDVEGTLIAGALSFIGGDTLYGRYWGSDRDYEFLHFETCYYQGIDYCLAQGLQHFDSGAQGEHKIQRGFEPITTWSNHWLAHPGFHAAIEQFLQEEATHVASYRVHAGEYLPFRKT